MIDFGDIEEGPKKVNTVRSYYMHTMIRSIDFLNLHHMDNFLHNRSTFGTPRRITRENRVLPIDALAVDVLCVNCYECIKTENVDYHS